MKNEKTLVLEGMNIHDIATFYEEINRVFMTDETWQLGESLDGLDDMLRGSYGATQGADNVILIWRNIEHSRYALGIDETRRWLHAKLAMPDTYASDRIRAQLAVLDSGDGLTYFEIIVNIIAEHERLRLIPG